MFPHLSQPVRKDSVEIRICEGEAELPGWRMRRQLEMNHLRDLPHASFDAPDNGRFGRGPQSSALPARFRIVKPDMNVAGELFANSRLHIVRLVISLCSRDRKAVGHDAEERHAIRNILDRVHRLAVNRPPAGTN